MKRNITSKKWKDRGGGRGFGWVSQKTTKYLCEPGIVAKRKPSVSNISKESRNLDRKTGCADNNLYLTRAYGQVETSDVGISSDYNQGQAVIHAGSLNNGAPREM